MEAISVAHDGEFQMIDVTAIRAHQQAATGKKDPMDAGRRWLRHTDVRSATTAGATLQTNGGVTFLDGSYKPKVR